MSAKTSLFDEFERTRSVVYGQSGGIWAMIIFAEPKLADMNRARPALQEMTNRFAAGYPTLTWVLPEAGFRMDSDARKAASEITRAFEGSILAQATLIEGTGFQVATVRAIVAGLDAVSGTRAPRKVFSELGPAIDWSVVRRPIPKDPAATKQSSRDDIVTALAEARAQLGAGRRPG